MVVSFFQVVPFKGFSNYACPFAFLADRLEVAARYTSKMQTKRGGEALKGMVHLSAYWDVLLPKPGDSSRDLFGMVK